MYLQGKEREVITMRDVSLLITCPFCGADHSVEINEVDYIKYTEGALAQVAFPYLNATEREQIVSHLCPKCQASVFGEDE